MEMSKSRGPRAAASEVPKTLPRMSRSEDACVMKIPPWFPAMTLPRPTPPIVEAVTPSSRRPTPPLPRAADWSAVSPTTLDSNRRPDAFLAPKPTPALPEKTLPRTTASTASSM